MRRRRGGDDDGGAARLVRPATGQAFRCVVEHEPFKSAAQSPQLAFRRSDDAMGAVLRTASLFWFGTHGVSLYNLVTRFRRREEIGVTKRRQLVDLAMSHTVR
jgi:hypothetical protein